MSTENESTYKGGSLWGLVRALRDHGQVGSQAHSEVIGALAATLTEHLVASIDRHEQAASRLAVQILLLNIVIGIFTVVGAGLAVVAFVQK